MLVSIILTPCVKEVYPIRAVITLWMVIRIYPICVSFLVGFILSVCLFVQPLMWYLQNTTRHL